MYTDRDGVLREYTAADVQKLREQKQRLKQDTAGFEMSPAFNDREAHRLRGDIARLGEEPVV